MNPISACNPAKIQSLLNDELDESSLRDLESHLEHCATCREQLDLSAAEQSWWQDAQTFLSGKSIDPAETINLDFLQPTDDPRMLGRLGTLEVCGVIGSGGMGIVLKAMDPSLNRYVAIKVLAPHLATSAAARRRFAREAQAAAAVVHDHVIAIHGVETEGPLPYLIMPYVKGESLQRRIDTKGPLPIEETLRIGMQIARGLAEAHDQGLIHRDIKPANILLPHNVERVVITDFGLARTVDDATLTRSGVIAGTPQYMSPEQAKGDAIDTRTDLFSLGSVLYTMATGRPPFRAETPYAIIRKIVEQDPTPLNQVVGETPLWLQTLVNHLHAKDPANRFATADKVADVMESCLAHRRDNRVALPRELTQTSQPNRLPRYLMIALAVLLLTAAGLLVRQGLERDLKPPESSEQLLLDVESEIENLLKESTSTDSM